MPGSVEAPRGLRVETGEEPLPSHVPLDEVVCNDDDNLARTEQNGDEGNGAPEEPKFSRKTPAVMHTWSSLFPNTSYAYPLLFGCVITSLAATPGQSFYLGLYTERMIEDFGASRAVISTIFGSAFLTSAVLVQLVGRIIDRFGPKRTIMFATVPFALGQLCLINATSLPMVAYGYISTRVLGVETIDLCARVIVNKWFMAKRGKAMGLLGLVLGIQILISGGFNQLMIGLGWRGASLLVLCVSLVEIVIGLALVQDTPESVGLLPDAMKRGSSKILHDLDFTYREAVRTPQLWFFVWFCFWPTIAWGGMNVHLKNIIAEQGLPEHTVSIVYIALGCCTPLSAMLTGMALDACPTVTMKIKACVAIPLLSSLSLVTAVNMTGMSVFPKILFGALSGLYVGCYQIVGFSMPAALYGRAHIGSIQAIFVAVGITGVSTGPLILGAAKDTLGSYSVPLWSIVVLQLIALPGFILLQAPTKETFAEAVRRGSWYDKELIRKGSKLDMEAIRSSISSTILFSSLSFFESTESRKSGAWIP